MKGEQRLNTEMDRPINEVSKEESTPGDDSVNYDQHMFTSAASNQQSELRLMYCYDSWTRLRRAIPKKLMMQQRN